MQGEREEPGKKSLSHIGSRSNIADKATPKHQGLAQDQISVSSKSLKIRKSTNRHTPSMRNQSLIFPQPRDDHFSMFSLYYLTLRVSKAQPTWFPDCNLSSVCVCVLERGRDIEARTLKIGSANPGLKYSGNVADGRSIVRFLTQRGLEDHPVGDFKNLFFRAVWLWLRYLRGYLGGKIGDP